MFRWCFAKRSTASFLTSQPARCCRLTPRKRWTKPTLFFGAQLAAPRRRRARPAHPGLAGPAPLKAEVLRDVDFVIIRELTSGIYFGEPRGIETLADGQRRGFNTEQYTTSQVRRVARSAFELARTRKGKVCSVDKANVLETSVLWREEVTALHAEEFSDVELSHMYVENAAMQIVRDPAQFDVMVTGNIFGDILSDCAAMASGSLGMLPSASLGPVDRYGRRE